MTLRSSIQRLLGKSATPAQPVLPVPPTSRRIPAPSASGATTPRSTTLVLVDSTANSNKFYRLSLDASGTVSKTYGRVGATGVTNTEASGVMGYERILREKLAKGYQQIDVAEENLTNSSLAKVRLATAAKSGLTSEESRNDAVIAELIDRIVRVNAHDIMETSGGLITVDTSGRVKTPVGLVTSASITEATALLARMEKAKAADRAPLLERYLTFVPQKVGSKAGWADTFFAEPGSFQSQRDFLQQLRDSIAFYDAQAKAIAEDPNGLAVDANFKYRIRAVSDRGAVFSDIQKRFEGTKNDMHSSSKLKLKRVFELDDEVGAAKFATIVAAIGNQQQLWHGTRAANLLSILRKGLFIPPTTGTSVQIAGRMFGDGVYLSSQSSKSLNYSHGYWATGGRDNNCFMLLNDVAMGSEYRPGSGYDPTIPHKARTTKNKFGKPWNSINVRPGHGGVRNHEAIVWNVDQIRVRYLCEFDS